MARQKTPKRSDAKALHEDILVAAAPFVKLHGIDVPVDKIMKAVGLTSGALYSHFRNKQDLCEQVICRALDQAVSRYGAILGQHGQAGLRSIIEGYLNEAHVSAVANGCPFTALGADMAKAGMATRRLYEARIATLIDMFAGVLGSGSEKQRRAKAQHIMASLIGALTFARVMADPGMAASMLSDVRTTLLRQLD